jgi:molybdopterin converting factor small subunit
VEVQVRLFANLAAYLPAAARGDPAVLEVAEGTTVGDLLHGLAIPAELPRLLLVNGQEPPALDHPLSAGDVVSVLPPLVGG